MKHLWSVAMLLIGIALSAQSYTLSGYVLDGHNHAELSGASIFVNGKKMSESDSHGRFAITEKKGTYQLTVAHPECRPVQQKINLNTNLNHTFYLEHHEEQLKTVTLRGKQRISSTSPVQSLNKTFIEQNSSQNLGNILSQISGVNTIKTGNNIAKPVIHGMYGSRILVINNDVRMAEQEWGVEHAPSVDANAFERLNLVKGAGTLRYGGDAIGGVVVLEPKVFAPKDTLMGSLSSTYNINGRGGNLVTELAKTWENRWFVKTQGAFKKMGDISTPDYSLQNTGTNEHTFSFGTGYRSVNQGIEFYYSSVSQSFGIFKGSHLGNAEDFINAVNGGQTLYTGDFSYNIDNPKQEVAHHLAKIEAYKRFSKIGKISLQYAFQLNRRKEYDIRRGEYNELPSMDLRLLTHQLSLTNLHEHENWTLESGISGAFQDNFPNPDTKARRLIPDYYRYDAGVFSVFEYRFGKLKAEAAARYDFSRYDAYKYYDESDWNARFSKQFSQFVMNTSGSRVLTHPVMDFHNFSANIGMNYAPADNLNFKLNFSRAERTPNPAELFAEGLHHSAAIIERGNLATKNETVYQANISAKWNADVLGGLQLEVSPYYMYSGDFINQNPSGALITIRGIFPVWDYQQIKAEMYGLDLDAQLNFTKNFRWNGQFSTVHGDDRTNGEPLILMVPSNFRNALQIDFPQLRNAFIKVENVTFLRQNRYPSRIVPVEMIENGQTITKTLDLTTPPPGYSIWNAFAGINLTKNLRADFGVTNLTNTRYREYPNRLRYFADAMGRNFYLTVNFKF